MALSSLLKPVAKTPQQETKVIETGINDYAEQQTKVVASQNAQMKQAQLAPQTQPQAIKVKITKTAKTQEPKTDVNEDLHYVEQMEKVEKPKPKKHVQTDGLYINAFQRTLRKAELFFGNPGTGKTYLAKQIAQELKETGAIEDFTSINCHEELTVMSILKTTKTDENGNWKFLLNKVFNMITDKLQQRYIIIFDEFNTLSMSVMKALQPIIDDSTGTFEFEEKTYTKNPNVQFIFTMNHDDIGISTLPDAINDRLFKVKFDDLNKQDLSERSGVPINIIELLERVYNMFEHLGNVTPFYKSVRRLKDIVGLTGEQLKDYLTSELELAHIDWKQATTISPEFNNVIDQFNNIEW